MQTPASQRIEAIDQFRGFAIILMVIFNSAMSVQTLPAWFKHSEDIGLTFPDIGTPSFVFAIGLTYGLSFQRRRDRQGLPATIGHFIRRYLSFIGRGAIISAGQARLGHNPVDF